MTGLCPSVPTAVTARASATFEGRTAGEAPTGSTWARERPARPDRQLQQAPSGTRYGPRASGAASETLQPDARQPIRRL